jgi:sporulation protein YlmC with PRC-barrel domain
MRTEFTRCAVIASSNIYAVAICRRGLKIFNQETEVMKHSILAGSVAAFACLGLAAPLLAEELKVTGAENNPSPGKENVSATKPAEKCLSDLHVFDAQMEKDGYWLGGSGYGYGYPMGGYGYGYFPTGGYPTANVVGYQGGRPGYEVRTLVASANILARHGQEQQCEDMLSTTRDIYKLYIADMRSGKVPTVNVPGWRLQQIAGARPVTSNNTSFSANELLGTDVRDLNGEALGSVQDFVTSPQTGKIAYLVIARGGIFGIDEKYVPVPWEDFKIAANLKLLVLDTTKSVVAAAPQVSHDQFAVSGEFDQESQKVDAYWKAQFSNKASN